MCLADDDGDGHSNGVELGDPCCAWSGHINSKSGAQKEDVDAEKPSNPGDPESHHSANCLPAACCNAEFRAASPAVVCCNVSDGAGLVPQTTLSSTALLRQRRSKEGGDGDDGSGDGDLIGDDDDEEDLEDEDNGGSSNDNTADATTTQPTTSQTEASATTTTDTDDDVGSGDSGDLLDPHGFNTVRRTLHVAHRWHRTLHVPRTILHASRKRAHIAYTRDVRSYASFFFFFF